MIAMRAVDIVQPDILYLGGIYTLRVVEMAAKSGLPVTALCDLSMVTLFTMHLLRAIRMLANIWNFY